MKIMFRKLSVLLLAILLLAASVAGCAGTPESSPSQNPAQQPSAPDGAGGDKAQDDTPKGDAEKGLVDYVSAADVFPISNENIELRFLVPQSTNVEDYYTNTLTEYIEEKANVRLVFDMVPGTDMVQKVQLILASFTDMPDAFLGVGNANANIFSATNAVRYGEEGQIIPLNDLIEAYGTNIKYYFDKYNTGTTLRQIMTSADGNIYYMPTYVPGVVNNFPNKMWINMTWIDALGLEIPTTLDGFTAMLRAFKNDDPNGNSKADEIPLTGSDDSTSTAATHFIMGSFTANNTQNCYLIQKNGKVEFTPISDEWREGLKYINSLCAEGLLSTRMFTQNNDTLKQIMNDPNNICGGFSSLGINSAVQSNDLGNGKTRYMGINPLKGPEGVQYAVYNTVLPMPNGVITTSCKYPAVVFRIFDLMMSEEGNNLSRFGIKGVHWDDAKEGQISKVGGQATLEVIQNIWAQPQNAHWQQINPSVNDIHSDGASRVSDIDPATLNSIVGMEYKNFIPDGLIPVLVYTVEENKTASETKISILDYVKESLAKFAVGEMDPNNDADWQRYVREFSVIGLDNFLEVSQAAYDRMNG